MKNIYFSQGSAANVEFADFVTGILFDLDDAVVWSDMVQFIYGVGQ
jgi:hypothetical protein